MISLTGFHFRDSQHGSSQRGDRPLFYINVNSVAQTTLTELQQIQIPLLCTSKRTLS